MSTETEDRQEIQRLHHQWVRANEGLHIDQMQPVMAGEAFKHFNLNGFTYDGLSEITKLWERMAEAFHLKALVNETNLRIEVRGDMGFLTVEADCELEMLQPDGSGNMKGDGNEVTMPFRMSEIFVRDDGYGNPVWKMWHFHCSSRLLEGPRFVTE
jgi:ketosteroid isomerase-like protein